MLEALPLLATTFAFVSIFLYIFSSVQLHDIRVNWNTRRCEPLVMLIAQRVPDPADPNIDASQFAADNFSFCINSIIDGILSTALAPLLGIFSFQLDATQPIHAAINTLRSSASNILTNPFNSYVNMFWKKIGYITHALSYTFVKMNSAFHRVFGILISSIFAGIAMYKGVLNVKNFIVKIVFIILYIIVALLFLLFIPLFPIIPSIIIPTIIVVAAAGGAVGGMQDAFNCVAPGTLVACRDGWRPVESLKVGDPLRKGEVKGVLKGIPGGNCVKIGKVIISSLHVVFDKKVDRWVHASEHSDAVPHASPETVYCLVTSTRTWTVEGELLLRDWNDIEEEDSDRMDEFIELILNNWADDVTPSKGGLPVIHSWLKGYF